MGHTQMGRKVLDDFIKLTEEVGEVEKRPRLEGRNMTMHLIQKSE